ncbi:MAG: spore photoproduct lyase [Clostridiaceae bacterium]
MFIPNKIVFEKKALDYEIGKNIYEKFKDKSNIEIILASSNRIATHITGENRREKYVSGKKTLVVGIKKTAKFQTCKPSAHFQLPLVSGCIGQCEYCYLNTQLGDKPYIKVNANLEDILKEAKDNIIDRSPEITIFEGAATSDPIPIEPYTNSLFKTIEFMGSEELARFRFVTKFNDVDSLLNARHNNHTEIRFSINTDKIIKEYEHGTASINLRLEAAAKIAKAGYKLGFIIAPVFLYDNWRKEYRELLDMLYDKLSIDVLNDISKQKHSTIGFEVISHRFTTKAKNIILDIYPETTLPMNEDVRTFKYGQFGYGKYVYSKEQLQEMKDFFVVEIDKRFKNKEIKYLI